LFRFVHWLPVLGRLLLLLWWCGLFKNLIKLLYFYLFHIKTFITYLGCLSFRNSCFCRCLCCFLLSSWNFRLTISWDDWRSRTNNTSCWNAATSSKQYYRWWKEKYRWRRKWFVTIWEYGIWQVSEFCIQTFSIFLSIRIFLRMIRIFFFLCIFPIPYPAFIAPKIIQFTFSLSQIFSQMLYIFRLLLNFSFKTLLLKLSIYSGSLSPHQKYLF